MSNPSRSVEHSTTNDPAEVLMIWPLLPGQDTVDATGAFVEVAVVAGTGAADETADDVGAEEDELAAGVDADTDEESNNLPPHTLPLEPTAPTPLFK
jgi:hypothetical protein